MMATTTCKDKIEAACYSVVLSSSLKDEQREIIVSFISGMVFSPYSRLVMEKAFVMLVYLAYLINFSILATSSVSSPQPTQYVATLGSQKQEIEV